MPATITRAIELRFMPVSSDGRSLVCRAQCRTADATSKVRRSRSAGPRPCSTRTFSSYSPAGRFFSHTLVATDYLNSYYGRLALTHLDGRAPQRRLIADVQPASAGDDPDGGPTSPLPARTARCTRLAPCLGSRSRDAGCRKASTVRCNRRRVDTAATRAAALHACPARDA